tara:strand:- start:5 stop:580 length:576 start_codon:yes stop_codon:yes gene_type:complete
MVKPKKPPIPPKPALVAARGYARDKADFARLQAAGLAPRAIYRADKGETLGKFKMRAGELLGVVDGLLALGAGRRAIGAAVKLVHGWGAAVLDVETGCTSTQHGVKMLNAALDPPKPSAEYLARITAEKREAWRVKNRVMPKAQAFLIWRNPNMSVAEKLALMQGWTKDIAYREFGHTGRPAGRPYKNPKE